MNLFASPSRFEITVCRSASGKTFVKDSFFTSPFKIMKPFAQDDGGIAVFLQSASPGILEGDLQLHKITVGQGASLEIRSQSFEKIFKMDSGKCAERKIFAELMENSSLVYRPLPCIPFSKSSFLSATEISLSKNSRLIYEDCICAGRCAHGETFDFTLYKNQIKIFRERKLVFYDNLFLEGSDGKNHPERKERLLEKTMFAGFTHCGSMLVFGYSDKANLKKIRSILSLEEKLLYTEENTNVSLDEKKSLLVEASENDYGDFIIRCLSFSAEKIQKVFEQVRNALK